MTRSACARPRIHAIQEFTMKPLPLSFVAALGFLLAGCFTSQTPKFPLASAVPLFGDGGRYIMFEHSGGEWRRRGRSW